MSTPPSFWLPTAPCTPDRCEAHPGPAAPRAGAVTGAVRLTAGLGAVLLGVLLSPLTAPLPAAARLFLVRVWCRAVLRAFGVRLRVTGAAPAPRGVPLLVVANHVSWLDIPLIAAVLPGRMLAKREVRSWPVLGPLAVFGGTVFIDRDRLRSLHATVGAMARALGAGGRVVVFPEGSTWCGRAGGVFRPAAFQAALDAGAEIQPVRIDYRPLGPAAFVGDDSLGASLWRIATARRLVAEIRLSDPLSSGRWPDRRSLARAAEAAVAQDSRLLPGIPAQPSAGTVAKDSANRSFSSVHQRESVKPASASSARTPS
ncbi:lysophospholipid acyltransferase family protein [Streptomyces sp. NPDC053493]|uniref:lysophospholipid acyltransferase family protein n=1 Tax=Streptomyces sp. NPDC053493 TaxID=3365705 RepID=UPI0037D8CCB2